MTASPSCIFFFLHTTQRARQTTSAPLRFSPPERNEFFTPPLLAIHFSYESSYNFFKETQQRDPPKLDSRTLTSGSIFGGCLATTKTTTPLINYDVPESTDRRPWTGSDKEKVTIRDLPLPEDFLHGALENQTISIDCVVSSRPSIIL